MAKEVSYWENFEPDSEVGKVAYSEGPFVMVNPSNGWRIEVKATKCPILPDPSIYAMAQKMGLGELSGMTPQRARVVCDVLNLYVQRGQIVQMGLVWVEAPASSACKRTEWCVRQIGHEGDCSPTFRV